ncbi:MAG: methyltransferase domain-containing protein [Candidatus Paceibacterota bacterium]
MQSNDIKNFYSDYADEIIEKRLRSPYRLRQYAHMKQYESILNFVTPGMKVLDAGCGEGVLSVMMAKKGAIVTGCDLSKPNVDKSKMYAIENKVGDNTNFLVGDAEKLPFPDSTFDLVVSSHVLEHLPDFDQGLREVMRVTKKRAVIAIPTILNLCSFVQVGHGWFYLKGLKSFSGLPIGFLKTLWAFVRGEEGVNESYAGNNEVPHVFRFPFVMKRKIKKSGYKLILYEASSCCFPYFSSLLPVTRFLDKYKREKILRNCGYGTTYVVEK